MLEEFLESGSTERKKNKFRNIAFVQKYFFHLRVMHSLKQPEHDVKKSDNMQELLDIKVSITTTITIMI